jgi:hypothetical protein
MAAGCRIIYAATPGINFPQSQRNVRTPAIVAIDSGARSGEDGTVSAIGNDAEAMPGGRNR